MDVAAAMQGVKVRSCDQHFQFEDDGLLVKVCLLVVDPVPVLREPQTT